MAYDSTKPAGSDIVGQADDDIRENFRAIKDDKIVNAYKLQDYLPGSSSGNIAINTGVLNTNLNADMLDGYHAGNANGNVPVSNGTLNENLNADMLDSQDGSYYRDASNINAGFLAVAYGGTGQSSYSKGDIIAASGATTLAKLAVGTNNQVLMADSSQTTGVKWGSFEQVIVFTLQSPENDERSAGIKLPRAFTASTFDLLVDIAPTASTTIQIYKNGALLDSLAISSTTATKSVTHSLSAGDVLYMKISGNSNSIGKLTGQLKVSG